jgi:hypothetical protein
MTAPASGAGRARGATGGAAVSEKPASTADGWYVVRPAIVGSLEDWDTVYYWDSREVHPDRAAAIAAGLDFYGHDDWNVGQVKHGALVWWGWMDEEHPCDDREYVAKRLGIPFAKPESGAS